MNFDTGRSLATDAVLAFVLLTRFPMPKLPDHAFQHADRAVWAYTLVGAAIGALAWACGYLALTIGLPQLLAAGFMIATLVACSGAMHEDGLADTVDGFWGGNSPEKRLDIMKDSTIGTYGTMSLLVVTGLRWSALAVLLPLGPAPVLAATCLSRAMMPLLMYALTPARASGLSHSVGAPPMEAVLAGLVLAVGVTGIAIGFAAIPALLFTFAVSAGIAVLAKRKIGGHTGDVLGATQQVSETAVLLVCLVALT